VGDAKRRMAERGIPVRMLEGAA
ncbi:MAG: hypothetical protein RIS59_595, partial [Pseudomonadota bacterium]